MTAHKKARRGTGRDWHKTPEGCCRKCTFYISHFTWNGTRKDFIIAGLFTGASNLICGLISIPELPSEFHLAPTEGDCTTAPRFSVRGDFCTSVHGKWSYQQALRLLKSHFSAIHSHYCYFMVEAVQFLLNYKYCRSISPLPSSSQRHLNPQCDCSLI